MSLAELASLAMAECVECGRYFHRPAGEDWRVRCVRCWLEHKGLQSERQPDATDIRSELNQNMRALLQLVHPDRHDGSEVANRVTAWLLSLRDRNGGAK